MSILIKDKALPKTCEECLFYGIDAESGCFLEKCYVIRRAGQEKPSWCPLGRVVMCKDCKYRDAGKGFCEGRGWPMQLVPDDGFCDKGKRSED